MSLVKKIKTNGLVTEVHSDRPAMGKAAAKMAADRINKAIAEKGEANVIFAAAPSQNETLAALLTEDVDFTKVNAFHMDEYAGLSKTHPQSFGKYLTDHIFGKAPFKSVNIISADKDIDEACKEYTELLTAHPADVICMGIGENGHIAFNDPPVADFKDTAFIKKVELDDVCRILRYGGYNRSCINFPLHSFQVHLGFPGTFFGKEVEVVYGKDELGTFALA